MSKADFHRVLAALDVPEDETAVAEEVLAAVRLGHVLTAQPHGRRSCRWDCRNCEARVRWSGGLIAGNAAKRSCADQIRHWQAQGLASDSMLAWLAKHDREASR